MQNPAVAASTRFNQRKQAVPDAAAVVIDRVGLGDTTLNLVAGEIGPEPQKPALLFREARGPGGRGVPAVDRAAPRSGGAGAGIGPLRCAMARSAIARRDIEAR
jgi:hypothetical protein